MKLIQFNTDTYKVEIEPEARVISPFKEIIAKHKTKAIDILTYIYLFSNRKSDFSNEPDPIKRQEIVLSQLPSLTTKIIESELVQQAISFYLERTTTISAQLLENAKSALCKVSDFLSEVEIIDSNVKTVSEVMKSIPTLNSSFKELEKQVLAEEQETSGLVGSKTKNTFEDGV